MTEHQRQREIRGAGRPVPVSPHELGIRGDARPGPVRYGRTSVEHLEGDLVTLAISRAIRWSLDRFSQGRGNQPPSQGVEA